MANRRYNTQTRKMFSNGTEERSASGPAKKFIGTKKKTKLDIARSKRSRKPISKEELKLLNFKKRMKILKKDKGFASSEFATAKDKQKFVDENRKYFPKTKMGEPSKALKSIKTELPKATPFKKGGKV